MVLKRAVALVATVGALALAGCGDEDNPNKDKVESVVRQFAASDNRKACDLLTPDALIKVYGGANKDRAYDTCIERSKKFQGDEVDIDDTDVAGDRRAVIKASTGSGDDERRFKITLRNISGTWLIDEIVEE